MKRLLKLIRRSWIAPVFLAGFLTPALAQEISIPDPGLQAAIRAELNKPVGPLSEQDLLSLTNLNARSRNISSLDGLGAARNLVSLDLQINHLSNLSVLSALTNLSTLDVSVNPLANFSLPSSLTNLASLTSEGCNLTNLTVPATLLGLTNLDVEGNDLPGFDLSSNLTRLVSLDLGFNSFTNFSLPVGLTNLSTFYFAGNPLTNVVLPPDLAGMTELNLSQNLLASFTLPPGMTNLAELDLAFNQLTNLALPDDLRNLTELDLDFNQFTSVSFPSNLTRLSFLHLRANLFTNFSLPAGFSALTYLDVSEGPLATVTLPGDLNHLTALRLSRNRLTSLTLPAGLTNLTGLNLIDNQLTNLVLPTDLNRLGTLDVSGNQLTSLNLPAGLTHLTGLFFVANQLTSLTLPPDMTQLVNLGFLANPLATFVLPETLAATNLAADVASMQNQGVSVFTYPLAVRLLSPTRTIIGAFEFTLTGPPGLYSVLGSADLSTWHELGVATNSLGNAVFTDATTILSPRRFYRVLRQDAFSNLVFIAPNTFQMGSPTNEQDRDTFTEGPQTTVILTRGFWIGKYEVTQGEYLSVMITNPSNFPGDLSRPVSSVTWFDATNYCWKLTQRELAAGRIPAGSQYRLPTEAEWECAARAGTSTRFSYGDDPTYASLTNYAWFLDLGHPDLTVHTVGLKLPNPWGLYDMAGNVWEWCQDWYGDQTGGIQTDPTGPASNPNGLKVMRGGAYDYPDSSCRSASRLFRFLLSPDTDLGFRVVLVMGPQ